MARKKTGLQQPRPGGKISTSYYLTPETLASVEKLAGQLGLTRSQVIERAIEEMVERSTAEAMGRRLERVEHRLDDLCEAVSSLTTRPQEDPPS